MVDIIMGYDDHGTWNGKSLNSYPGSVIDFSSEPVAPMDAIPVAIMKVDARHVRDQIDLCSFARNHHDVGWGGKFKRGRGLFDLFRRRRFHLNLDRGRGRRNINVDLHIRCPGGERRGNHQTQGNHGKNDPLHSIVPPFI
jgi:hypothetical protein